MPKIFYERVGVLKWLLKLDNNSVGEAKCFLIGGQLLCDIFAIVVHNYIMCVVFKLQVMILQHYCLPQWVAARSVTKQCKWSRQPLYCMP